MATTDDVASPPPPPTVYKMKTVNVFGRQTPIILQNDNGPCPLLAICNWFLLRDGLDLHGDDHEVSLEKLLSVIAHKLLEISKRNEENKDAGFVENQQKNLSDALDILPHLATGIDVNVQFTKPDLFEFTRERALFDVLGIPLYHGWIVDPQDSETALALGSKSYNALMGELVALETKDTDEKLKANSEEDCIDFAAATTAALGVPSPCLPSCRSFDDSPRSTSSFKDRRKGDLEEEAELLKALQITSSSDAPLSLEKENIDASVNVDESTHLNSLGSNIPLDSVVVLTKEQYSDKPELSLLSVADGSITGNYNLNSLEMGKSDSSRTHANQSTALASFPMGNGSITCSDNSVSSEAGERESSYSAGTSANESTVMASDAGSVSCNSVEDHRNNLLAQNQNELSLSVGKNSSSAHEDHLCEQDTSSSLVYVQEERLKGCEVVDVLIGVASDEPIYEGEDCILDSETKAFESGEPMYEGEIALAEQADKVEEDISDVHSNIDKSEWSRGALIKKFFDTNASQLTIEGLFALHKCVQEGELCVFFRNNHFSTMYKFNGELYLLATDQGYLNQPTLVWEKLNEVNGDSEFFKGNFTEFRVEQVNDTWDEQHAIANTTDFIAGIDNSEPSGSLLTSDLELAMALQNEELVKDTQPQSQPQLQPQRISNTQRSSGFNSSGLVTGPQTPRTKASSSSSSKHEGKSKEKNNCTIM